MKKIFSIALVVAGCFFALACSDNNNEYIVDNAFKVVNAKTTFGAVADTTFIHLTENATKVETDAEWLNTDIMSDSVRLVASENNLLTSRSAKVTLFNDRGTQLVISVTQQGAFFDVKSTEDITLEDTEKTRTIDVESNKPFTVETNQSWIKTRLDSKSFTLELEENNTGRPRLGSVTVKVSGQSQKYNVIQASMSDVIQDYRFVAREYNSRTGAQQDRELVASIERVSNDSVVLVINNSYRWGGKYLGGGRMRFKAGENVRTVTGAANTSRYVKAGVIGQDGQYLTFLHTDASVDLVPYTDGIFNFIDNGSTNYSNTYNIFFGYYSSRTIASEENLIGFDKIYLAPQLLLGQ